MKRFLRPFAALVAVCCFVSTGLAQTSSGTISGHVVDVTGAVIVGADVELINEQTGVVVRTKVLTSGDFIFPDVQPGTFDVLVRMTSYKELRKQGLRLSSGGTAFSRDDRASSWRCDRDGGRNGG